MSCPTLLDMSNPNEQDAVEVDQPPAWALALANAIEEAQAHQFAFNTMVYEKLVDLHPLTPELMQQIVEHVTPKPGPSAGELAGRIDATLRILGLATDEHPLDELLGIKDRASHLGSIIAAAVAVLRGPA